MADGSASAFYAISSAYQGDYGCVSVTSQTFKVRDNSPELTSFLNVRHLILQPLQGPGGITY